MSNMIDLMLRSVKVQSFNLDFVQSLVICLIIIYVNQGLIKWITPSLINSNPVNEYIFVFVNIKIISMNINIFFISMLRLNVNISILPLIIILLILKIYIVYVNFGILYLLLTLWPILYQRKTSLVVFLWKRRTSSVVCSVNIISNGLIQAIRNNIVAIKTTELVLLFHKKTTKLVFLCPNVG